jgi:hypothetical protein
MKVKARDLAIRMITVTIVAECVDCVRNTVDWGCRGRKVIAGELRSSEAKFFGDTRTFSRLRKLEWMLNDERKIFSSSYENSQEAQKPTTTEL